MNSVGFYQLFKLSTIPCMILHRFFFKDVATPLESLCCLAISMVGLSLFAVNDLDLSLLGIVLGSIGTLTTTVWQVSCHELQLEYSITGAQFNELVAFPQFVMCFASSCAVEVRATTTVYGQHYPAFQIWVLLLTGLLAAFENLIAAIVIGRIGPINFQLIGHIKTVLIFVCGMVLFPPNASHTPMQHRKKVAGLSIALLGLALFGYYEFKARRKEQTVAETILEPHRSAGDPMLAERTADQLFPVSEK
jgi:solute carrier family 35 protein E3